MSDMQPAVEAAPPHALPASHAHPTPTAIAEAGKDVVAPASAAAPSAGATLTEEAAVAIFVAKHTHTTRDSLSCKLASQYGITSKSVRGRCGRCPGDLRLTRLCFFPRFTSRRIRRRACPQQSRAHCAVALRCRHLEPAHMGLGNPATLVGSRQAPLLVLAAV